MSTALTQAQRQRRTLLKLGLGSAVLLAAGGFALRHLPQGFENGKLSGAAKQVFLASAQAVLDGSLPTEPIARQVALAGLMGSIELLIANLPAPTQAELSQLLLVLASAPGRRLLAGLDEDWQTAKTADVQAAMQRMRTASLSAKQQAYHALHDISAGAYFSDPSTWALMGYPGPMPIA